MASKIVKSDAEWESQLDPEQYQVARQKATEPPFTGKYWDLHDPGVFRCVCCGAELFSSGAKFESGSGWPSFWAPIVADRVREESDSTFGMARTEVLCGACDAHLGHLFEDGPKPTGLRYCVNSASLDFVKDEKKS
ncbi:MAG: peptide-methionine (R)-S-oxide reductase MsrB [Terriglobia bacterium]